MRILLTGGTGFIGRALRAALERRGDEVVVVSRGGPVSWDTIEREAALADAVVHLAGEPIADGRWTRERLERIRSSRVDTTDRVARAVAGAPRKPRVLVSASAVGIYGMRRDDTWLDETTPAGDDELARLCVEWEAAARPARDAGVRVVHPRIGVVLGRGGGALAKMEGPFRWFFGGPIGDGTQWLSWIHLNDAVRALVFALEHDALSGPFNLTAPAPVSMDAFAQALGRAMRRPAFVRVPPFALRLAVGDGLARVLLTGQRAAPRALEAAGFAFGFRDLAEALRDLL